MTSRDTDSKQASVTKVIYRFLGGAALGAFLVAIPILYGSSIDLSLVQVGIASVLVISCGLLSSVWGEKFVEIVMRMLDGAGF
jgi:ABC-type dipeptide/oligopeptide/nickel transport system permease subunit